MSVFDSVNYWFVSEIPKGWTIGERVGAENAMRGLGVQSSPNPAMIMHMRPIKPTLYDEDKNPTQAADEWLLAGDLTNVTRDDIVQVIAAALGINPTAVDAKIVVTARTHEEKLQYLRDNAAAWGDA